MQNLIANCLATWRLTSLLVNEPGPYDVFGQFRDIVGIEYDELGRKIFTSELAKMFGCFWCCSIWVGILIAILRKRPLIEALAYSAGAIYLHYSLGEYLG